jgi:c-di-GMP-binding flagellar brake protein YcgR
MKEECAMDTRQYRRASADLSVLATDEAGFASGQVVDITIRGCGLRLTKPLRLGQHVMLKISPDNGTAAVQCDLAQVQWVAEEQTGVAFLRMSPDNERRLHQLCLDQVRREHENVPGTLSRRVAVH